MNLDTAFSSRGPPGQIRRGTEKAAKLSSYPIPFISEIRQKNTAIRWHRDGTGYSLQISGQLLIHMHDNQGN